MERLEKNHCNNLWDHIFCYLDTLCWNHDKHRYHLKPGQDYFRNCSSRPYILALDIDNILDYPYRKNYMILNADAMIVRSPFINSIEPQTIAYSEIICLEYYTYFSAKSWLMLLTSFVAPQSVFIIYTKNGEKRSSLIGYLERKQIIDIAQKHELTIVMK